ncbi:hypothetical protein H9Q72_013471 [Fusarium xylarioides]|uniref:Ankyrin repeat protein n=1 Tax=Fusarium xylarioides TaxID=221167 RepID=A0A9P7HDQ9_9HYPO|nr:hypothetical protein H9Q70_012723 [Fusarium xylarioides]KAG5758395.1 hypothetical protein H9Q72_013471 [Fusarium xylarioides]KAG5770671.1 hypothetical protein H9Q73_013113 [Fusarium xylarioides]
MSSQEEQIDQLSPEEQEKQSQEAWRAHEIARQQLQLAKLRQQATQAAQRSQMGYNQMGDGTPSNTSFAYPLLNQQQRGMPLQEGQLAPEERQKRLQEAWRAVRDQPISPQALQQAKIRKQAQQAAQATHASQMGYRQMGDGIPHTCRSDIDINIGLGADVPDLMNFLSACREGDLSTVQTVISSQSRSPLYLHKGLLKALENGKVDIFRYLLRSGAPVTHTTPETILRAPEDKQIALFQVLTEHGWTVNTPKSLLPELIRSNNGPLLDWFLENGADPNLAGPHNEPTQTLRLAASQGTVQLVQKLLNAGAKMASVGLYWAAGACPEGQIPTIRLIDPTAEFDKSRIPVMELLLENGGDVNHRLGTHSMEALYPIVNAVMAGAVERVKWLLSKGADPDLKGPYGSARTYAKRHSSDEMKQVLGVQE